MGVSQKCEYALRAVFELAKRGGRRPISIAKIAGAQAIPRRFLELIFAELKRGGFVESRRGARGGYLLTAAPRSLTVGEIIRFIEGAAAPVNCTAESGRVHCPLSGGCPFLRLWQRARDAVAEVYETTLQDLIDQQRAEDAGGPTYCI